MKLGNPFRCTVTFRQDPSLDFKKKVYPHTLSCEPQEGGSFYVEYRTGRDGKTEQFYYAPGTWITVKLEVCLPGDELPGKEV